MYLFVLFVLIFVSCTKEDNAPYTDECLRQPPRQRTLSVQTQLLGEYLGSGAWRTSPIPDVKVSIYVSVDDRNARENIIATQITDADGYASFDPVPCGISYFIFEHDQYDDKYFQRDYGDGLIHAYEIIDYH